MLRPLYSRPIALTHEGRSFDHIIDHHHLVAVKFFGRFPLVLRDCWLGDRNIIWPVENLCHSSSKVPFRNKSRKTVDGEPANAGSQALTCMRC